jgi:hypothetical protein
MMETLAKDKAQVLYHEKLIRNGWAGTRAEAEVWDCSFERSQILIQYLMQQLSGNI